MIRNRKRQSAPRSARHEAAIELDRMERTGAYVGLSRRGRDGNAADERMIRELVSGVTRWRRFLDFLIDRLYNGDPTTLETGVRTVLRIAVYEMIFTETPDHAVVHEAVETARSYIHLRVTGLVNGILRSLLRGGKDLDVPESGNDAHDLAIRYSHPDWVVEAWMKRMPRSEVVALLEYDNERPTYGVHVVKCRDEVFDLFEKAEAAWMPSRWLPGFITTGSLQHLVRSDLFRKGIVRIQEEAAALVVEAMAPEKGESILDVCAAPGGKTVYAGLRMDGDATLVASDLNKERLGLVSISAYHLGLEVEIRRMDAGEPHMDLLEQFDRVLVDAPCTGLGVLSKRADLRWQRTLSDAESLPELQLKLLHGAAQCVKPGGLLVYSTCTFEPKENEEVADRFLETHQHFEHEPVPAGFPAELVTERGDYLSIPSRTGMDGAFATRLRKTTGDS